ncbi:MAG: metallophosphoesterase family protein [Sciscionella sp.]
MSEPSLLATSDLHVSHPGNRELVDGIRPRHEEDWLIVAGDVAETTADIEATLRMLRDRFAKVIWTPGNHELWTTPRDEFQLRGEERYLHLVELCRGMDVLTPEDEYPVWRSEDDAVVVAPLFLLYDYSYRDQDMPLDAALEHARDTGVVCTDEYLLHPDPYPSRVDWCRQRIAATLPRLADIDPAMRTVLVSHWPLCRDPTRMLRYPQFAMWCGTELTADWHQRFRAATVVYGHLHIPLTFSFDGVRFEEVSLGYPREWRSREYEPQLLRCIVPSDDTRKLGNHYLEGR